MKTRIEADSIGSLEVPSDAYYGVQSLRAKRNFPITGTSIHPVMIQNLAKIKKAAAISNREAQRLPEEKAAAIIYACDEIIAGKLKDQFIVDGIQGGAGTSANMNANEVIANRAIEILGGTKGDYTIVHPNDHVNMAQSTNDVIPSAGKLTVLDLLPDLLHALESLHAALLDKSQEFDHILKMGRTQLEDAVPMRLGQSFHAYATMIERDIRRIERARKELFTLNLGGTAIGTTINASDYYLHHIVPTLAAVTGYPLMQACKKAQQGAEFEEVVAYIRDYLDRVRIYFSPFTLQYVKKSGRVSCTAAFVGELIGLRPVISAVGTTSVVEKVRGNAAILSSMEKMFAAQRSKKQENAPYMILVARDTPAAQELAAACEKIAGYPPVGIYKIGAAITINTGPQIIGLTFLAD